MTAPTRLHAGCVAIGGRGVLIAGRSGAGKSDLALRLVDRGARLVSDDYTDLWAMPGGGLRATAPAGFSGRIEVRGVGIVTLAADAEARVALLIDCDLPAERMPPERQRRRIAGADLPWLALAPLEPSAPIKVELALAALA